MFLLPNRHASQVHALSALRARAELDQKFCQGISSLWYGSCGVQGTAHVLSAFMDARGFEYALADGSGGIYVLTSGMRPPGSCFLDLRHFHLTTVLVRTIPVPLVRCSTIT